MNELLSPQHEIQRLPLSGEMLVKRAKQYKNTLLTTLAQSDTLEIDLSGVSDIDSSGVQLIVLAKSEAKLQGKTLRLTGVSPPVQEILALFALTDRLESHTAPSH